MATLNQVVCLSTSVNTGTVACPFTPGRIVGFDFVRNGTVLDITDFPKAYMDGVNNPSPSLRIYPINGGVEFKQSGGDLNSKTYPGKVELPISTAPYKFEITLNKGGMNLSKNLEKFKNGNWSIFLKDENNVYIGLDTGDPKKIAAIPTYFTWNVPKFNDGNSPFEIMVTLSFDAAIFNKSAAWVTDDNIHLSSVNGLLSVLLSGVADATSGTYDVTPKGDDGTFIGDIYSSQLSVANMWQAYNTATAKPIAITGVTYNTISHAFAVALTKADPNYPTTGTVSIDLVSTTALSAAGVIGFASAGPAVITRN